ncbi:MAG: serine--tRNA ligase, partial [Candidatus Altiarchaeota archaeon]|nr:serine--tRNA ligase [Candidatus Altiarchaeota archaeon]
MPQIKNLRDKQEEYLAALKNRFSDEAVFKDALELYGNFVKAKKSVDDLRAQRNKKTVEYAKNKDAKIIQDVKVLKTQIFEEEAQLKAVEKELRAKELILPNWVHKDVPIGKDESQNVATKYVGTPLVEKKNESEFKSNFPTVEFRTTDEKMLHHADLVEIFGLADLETASKISGSRFYIEKDELVMLDLALTLHTMKEFNKLGFSPVIPPYMMKRSVEEKITFFTSFEEAIYNLVEDDLILITTSEHPLAAMYQNTILNQRDLPIRLVAFSPAFRREAGSHGKDTKGIFRAHHFNKVELHSIVGADDDIKELDFLIDCVEKVMAPLGFPYRLVRNSSGDMDNRATIQYDLEAWFPAQNKFRELHSIATVGSWISEKLNTKVIVNNEKLLIANLYATGA